MTSLLGTSRALWNRASLDLTDEGVVAQILDRGELAAWRELYALARTDPALRARIARVVYSVPLPFPHFWLAALANLSEAVDWDRVPPGYGASDV